MLNKIIIHGRLGKDPDLKRDAWTDSKGEKQDLVNFSLAVGRNRGDETDWFKCTHFGPRAKVIEKYARKGDDLIVVGRMQSSKRDNVTYWDLIVDDFDFCGRPGVPSESKQKPIADDIPDSFQAAEEDCPF